MKIIEAVSQIDGLRPNAYSAWQKVNWLSGLEALVHSQVLKAPFAEFTPQTDTDTELTMAAPFDAAYLYWLEAQIHYANEDIELYNSAIRLFNDVWRAFQQDYHRNRGGQDTGRFRF